MREADRQQWEQSTTIANNARITVGGPYRDGCVTGMAPGLGYWNIRFPNGVEGTIEV